MQQLLDLQQSWTFEDLQELSEDVDWRRYEIVDGALAVSPSPAYDHEVISALVRMRLQESVPPGYLVVGPMILDLHPSYPVPDLLITPLGLFGRGRRLITPTDP